jgi:hypothetical protein
MKWNLEFYRDDQAADYAAARDEGALRVVPLDDGPRLPMAEAQPFTYGQLADMVALIDTACDMMEAHAVIRYFLTCDGAIVDTWPEADNV